MMKISYIIALVICLRIVKAFVGGSVGWRMRPQKIMMAGEEIVIVGVAAGVAETLACSLVEKGQKVTAVLDRVPVSPVLRDNAKAGKLGLFVSEDIERDGDIQAFVPGIQAPASITSLLHGKRVIAVGDEGDSELRGNPSLDDGFGRTCLDIDELQNAVALYN